jgi:hypothetical protein
MHNMGCKYTRYDIQDEPRLLTRSYVASCCSSSRTFCSSSLFLSCRFRMVFLNPSFIFSPAAMSLSWRRSCSETSWRLLSVGVSA